MLYLKNKFLGYTLQTVAGSGGGGGSAAGPTANGSVGGASSGAYAGGGGGAPNLTTAGSAGQIGNATTGDGGRGGNGGGGTGGGAGANTTVGNTATAGTAGTGGGGGGGGGTGLPSAQGANGGSGAIWTSSTGQGTAGPGGGSGGGSGPYASGQGGLYGGGSGGTGVGANTGGQGIIVFTYTDTTKTVFITSGSTFTIPSDFGSLVSIEAIGSGAGSFRNASAGGAGGGAYAFSNTVSGLIAGNTAFVSVGIGGVAGTTAGAGANSWFNVGSAAAPTLATQGVLARGGTAATTSSGGAGGLSASSIGNIVFAGGTGGAGNATSSLKGGGGGAGGPGGAGGTGGAASVTASQGAGGGGSGATLTAAGTAGQIGQASAGGAGGASTGQTGGSGGISLSSPNVTPPANGGGGGGGFTTINQNGGAGGTGTYWAATVGGTAGSGGGGGGSAAATSATGGGGGAYGGGAGGSSVSSVSTSSGGAGVLVFTYIPTPSNLYWVGGSNTWNTTSNVNWSTTSGGTGNTFVPSPATTVIVDANSGSPTITLSGSLNCSSIITTGATCTITGTGSLTVGGNVTLSSTTTWSAANTLTLTGVANSTTSINVGSTLSAPIVINATTTSNVITLSSNVTTTNTVTLTSGILNLNNYILSCDKFVGTGTTTRSISFGTSTIDITYAPPVASATVLDITNATSFAAAGAGGFQLTGYPFSGTRTVVVGTTGGSVSTAPNLLVPAGGDQVIITTGSQLNSLNFDGFGGMFTPPAALTLYGSLTVGDYQTWTTGTGTITFAATSTGKTITTKGNSLYAVTFNGVGGGWTLQDTMTATNAMTLTNGTLTLNGFDASCNTFVGTGTSARGITFGSNFVNITSTATATVLNITTSTLFTPSGTGGFKLTGAAASAITRTAVIGTTGGAVATAPSVFVSAGAAGSIFALTTGSWVQNLNFTGFSGTFAPAAATTITGSLTAVSGMTWTTGTGTITFAATSTGKTITTAGKSLYAVTFNGVGGGWTLQDNFTILSGFTLTAGSFNTNNFNVTADDYVITGTTARTLTMGSGTFTVTGIGTGWDATDPTNLTLNANTSTITFTATSSTGTFVGGGKTYYNLTIAGGANTSRFDITGANIFNTLSSSRTGNYSVRLPAGVTTTVANWSIAGTSGSTNFVSLISSTAGTQATLSVASGTVNPGYAYIQDSNATGGATFVTTNAVNGGNNTGWFGGTQQGLYWVGGSGTWTTSSTTNWSNISGGAAGYPPPTSTANAFFDSNSGSGTVTINSASAAPVTANNFTTTGSSFTFASASSSDNIEIYGGLTLSSTTTWTAPGLLYFLGSGTITTNGVSISSASTYINGVSYTLGSAFTTTDQIRVTGGTLTLNGFNLNCDTFNGSSGTGTLILGSNNVNITSTSTATVLDTTGMSGITGTGAFRLTGAAGGGITRTISTFTNATPNISVTAGAGTVTITSLSRVNNLDFTGFTGTYGTISSGTFITGNLTFVSGMSFSSGLITFSGSSTQLVTTAGKTLAAVTIDGVGTNVTLQDSLTSSGVLTLTNGTLTLNGFDASCLTFSGTGTSARSVVFGNNNINITQTTTSTVLNITTATNFTPSGTGGFKLTGVSPSGNTRTVVIGTTGGSATTAPNLFVSAGQSGSIFALTTASWVRDLDFTGFSGTFAPAAATTIAGSLTAVSGMTWTTGTGTITFAATSTGKTITSAGKSLYATTFNGVGGGWTLQDNLTQTNNLTVTNGTLSANDKNITAVTLTVNGGTLNG